MTIMPFAVERARLLVGILLNVNFSEKAQRNKHGIFGSVTLAGGRRSSKHANPPMLVWLGGLLCGWAEAKHPRIFLPNRGKHFCRLLPRCTTTYRPPDV